MALPYLKHEKESILSTDPLQTAGIGRFVMGLLNEIKIVGPQEFKEYVRKKLGAV